jgi:hypothetical protein
MVGSYATIAACRLSSAPSPEPFFIALCSQMLQEIGGSFFPRKPRSCQGRVLHFKMGSFSVVKEGHGANEAPV